MADAQEKTFAPGVTMSHSVCWDDYVGTLDALVSAGLVRADQVPGAPGQNKTSMTMNADGSPVRFGSKSSFSAERAGCRKMWRRGKLYQIRVWVPADVMEARRETKAAHERLEALQARPAAYDGRSRWYREGWEAACAVVEHRGYPAPSFDGTPRQRAVLPAGWQVIQGGRHA